jgi:hypothetical protein
LYWYYFFFCNKLLDTQLLWRVLIFKLLNFPVASGFYCTVDFSYTVHPCTGVQLLVFNKFCAINFCNEFSTSKFLKFYREL